MYTNTVDSPRGLQRLAIDLHRPSSSLGLVRIFTAINTSTRNRSLYAYSKLSAIEVQWRDLSDFLESKGYVLRPRYRKGWTPSWLLPENKHRSPEQFEDHITLPDTVRHDILCSRIKSESSHRLHSSGLKASTRRRNRQIAQSGL